MHKKEILLFIPTLNEEKYIKIILEKLEKYNESFDVLIIDDNSSDNTVKNFNNHKGNLNKSIIIRKNKLGIGSAHLDGIKYAKNNNYKFLLTMDCDLCHDPKYISIFLKLYKEYDFLIGSRYKLSTSLVEWSFFRRIITYIRHYICVIFLNIEFDTSTGFRMYKLECFKNDFFDFIDSEDYSFFIQSGFYIKRKQMKVMEIPVNMPKRRYGDSKMKMKHILTALILVFRLWLIKLIK